MRGVQVTLADDGQQALDARLPVVALTAGAFADDRQQCLDAGMDEVLTKPITKDALEATLARWLVAGVPL